MTEGSGDRKGDNVTFSENFKVRSQVELHNGPEPQQGNQGGAAGQGHSPTPPVRSSQVPQSGRDGDEKERERRDILLTVHAVFFIRDVGFF